jgi:hypothetical protein
MTKRDLKALFYLILLLGALAVLPEKKGDTKFLPPNTPPGTPMYI